MGLAYNLDVSALSTLTDWSQNLLQGNQNLFSDLGASRRGDSSTTNADILIPVAGDADYAEFDIIIRNASYVQDHYIICGSYRAFFTDLDGGNGAWAWDGFVTLIRAHNINFVDAFTLDGPDGPPENSPLYWLNPGFLQDFGFVNQPFDQSNLAWTYLCRMPYELDPGLTGIGSDSTPGVYAIDSAKSSDNAQTIRLVVGGHSRINTAVEGGLTGQNYSAWISYLNFIITPPELGQLDLQPLQAISKYEIEFDESSSVTISQNGAANVGAGLPATTLYPTTAKNLTDVAISPNTTAVGYTSVDLDSWGNGYYLTRIHDVVCVNTAPIPYNAQQNLAWITGEVAYATGAGAVNYTIPHLSAWDFLGEQSGTPVITGDISVMVGDRNWQIDTSVAAYNLIGAYGTVIAPSFSSESGTQDPVQLQIMVGVDRVSHGASRNAEIYACNYFAAFNAVQLLNGSQQYGLWPFGVKGGPIETVAGITLPDKWYAKSLQQKTFTQDQEFIAKGLEFLDNPILTSPGYTLGPYILDAIPDKGLERTLEKDPTLTGAPEPINFYAGIRPPNQQIYGASNEPAFTGQPANIAYGFLGYTATDGPQVIMYDFGTVTMTYNPDPTPRFIVGTSALEPQKVGADIINFGNSINSAIIKSPSSSTRIPVSGGWDVDRDQWVYTFADSTGGTLLSCNSAFDRQPPNQVAYLDQTDQFPNLDADNKSAYYIPRNMTPFLDGLVLWGGEVDTTQLGQRAIQSILIDAPTYPGSPTTQQVRGFQPYELQGTTGRTARVWVDYLLYDNIDSLVAVVIQELGLRVTVENVEWYKRKILNNDVLNMSNDEVEAWIDAQQAEYRKMLIDKERQGRLRRRRRQQSAIANGLEEIIQGEFLVSEQDFVEDDFIERNLRDMNSFPDQDSQLKRQISSDAQWLQGESLYGTPVPRKETVDERRKKEETDPKTKENDDS